MTKKIFVGLNVLCGVVLISVILGFKIGFSDTGDNLSCSINELSSEKQTLIGHIERRILFSKL